MHLSLTVNRTFVSALSAHQLATLISNNTRQPDLETDQAVLPFNGRMTQTGFRISSTIPAPQNAIPLAVGTIETTSKGSILFIRFQLFPAAKLYLNFSSGMCLFIAMAMAFLFNEFAASVAALFAMVLNYVVLVINFNRKVKAMLQQFEEILHNNQYL